MKKNNMILLGFLNPDEAMNLEKFCKNAIALSEFFLDNN